MRRRLHNAATSGVIALWWIFLAAVVTLSAGILLVVLFLALRFVVGAL